MSVTSNPIPIPISKPVLVSLRLATRNEYE